MISSYEDISDFDNFIYVYEKNDLQCIYDKLEEWVRGLFPNLKNIHITTLPRFIVYLFGTVNKNTIKLDNLNITTSDIPKNFTVTAGCLSKYNVPSTNKYCIDCVDCSECSYCVGCYNCNKCEFCKDCAYSIGSVECVKCRQSIENALCNNCTNCNNCVECNFCDECSECTLCENCNECKDCYSCTDLLSCKSCERSKQLKNCNHLEECSYCIDCNNVNNSMYLIGTNFVDNINLQELTLNNLEYALYDYNDTVTIEYSFITNDIIHCYIYNGDEKIYEGYCNFKLNVLKNEKTFKLIYGNVYKNNKLFFTGLINQDIEHILNNNNNFEHRNYN